jgi:hypothetical protein
MLAMLKRAAATRVLVRGIEILLVWDLVKAAGLVTSCEYFASGHPFSPCAKPLQNLQIVRMSAQRKTPANGRCFFECSQMIYGDTTG